MGTAGAGAETGQATRTAAERLGRLGSVITTAAALGRPIEGDGYETVGCSWTGADQGRAGEGLLHMGWRDGWMDSPEPAVEKINRGI